MYHSNLKLSDRTSCKDSDKQAAVLIRTSKCMHIISAHIRQVVYIGPKMVTRSGQYKISHRALTVGQRSKHSVHRGYFIIAMHLHMPC